MLLNLIWQPNATSPPTFSLVPISLLLGMNWREHIVSDPEVLLGKPTLKGTRLSVEHLVGLLAQGWTEDQLFKSYPQLHRTSLQAIFSFLKACMEDGLLICRK